MATYADIQGTRAAGHSADAQPDRVTMRLLVIEDDRDAADYLVKAFREVGHVADSAHDGEDGLAMALDGQYDVLIVDRMLPKRDGLSVIGTLRAKKIEPRRLFSLPLARSMTVSKACAPAATTISPSPIHSPSCSLASRSCPGGAAAVAKTPFCASAISNSIGYRIRCAVVAKRSPCSPANSGYSSI